MFSKTVTTKFLSKLFVPLTAVLTLAGSTLPPTDNNAEAKHAEAPIVETAPGVLISKEHWPIGATVKTHTATQGVEILSVKTLYNDDPMAFDLEVMNGYRNFFSITKPTNIAGCPSTKIPNYPVALNIDLPSGKYVAHEMLVQVNCTLLPVRVFVGVTTEKTALVYARTLNNKVVPIKVK